MRNINQRKISINKIKDLLSAVMLTALLGMLFIMPIFGSNAQAALIVLDTKVQVSAAIEIWNGSVAESFLGGKGTKESPYQIASGAQLAYLAQEVNEENTALNASSVYYILTNDIYLNGTAGWGNWAKENPDITALNKWTPIGKRGNEFAANFDGNGFTVEGIYINDTSLYQYQGLFGRIKGGKISNLGVRKSYIRGSKGTGGIAGEIIGDESAIMNCSNSGNISSVSNVGGVAGYVSSGSILINSYNTGNVTCDSDNIGGLVGSVRGLVANCYNTGDVSAEGWTVGGVVGYLIKVEEGSSTILNCYSTGKISGKGQVGGVVGVVSNGSFAYYCYYLKTTEINKDLLAADGAGIISNVSAFDKIGALVSGVTVCGTVFSVDSLLTDTLNAYASYENENNSGVFDTWEGQPFPRFQKNSVPPEPVPSEDENDWKWYYTFIIVSAVVIFFAAGTAAFLVYRKKAGKVRKYPALLSEMQSADIFPVTSSLSSCEVDAVRLMLQDKQNRQSFNAFLTLPEDLTLREREIAGLILEGKKAKEIADKLFISTATVKNHIQNILRKSDCPNQVSFVVKYASNGNGRTQA